MSNFNKLITNKPVVLTEQEVANLSETLSAVLTAGGGGGQTKTYIGDGTNISINQDTGVVRLTPAAEASLYRDIPSAISSFSDADQYAKKADYFNKNDINEMLLNKQDKLLFGYDEDNAISSINGSAIADTVGITGDYSAGTDLKIENNIISVDTNGNPNNTASNTRNFVEGSWTEASGYNSHAEGMATSAYGYAVHAQGMWTKFSSSKWSDSGHPTPIDIYWAAGAGATVEGYCNATTSCPMSGTVGQSDYGPIHGGILKVIGNGNVVHDQSVDPDAHIHRLQPSDALIIFKDGCISAAGNISANGIELGEGGTSYQGRSGVNVVGDYVELTQTAYESVTSVPSISNDVDTLKGASGNWDKVSAKLDTTAFSTVSGKFLTAHQSLDDYYTKTQVDSTFASATQLNNYLTTAKYQSDSATFALKSEVPTTVAQLTDSGNYYQKNETSGKTEITNALNTKLDSTAAAQTYQPKGDYVSSTDITDMATKTWVGNQHYLTEVPSEYVTDTELQTTLGNYATNTLVQNTSASITALIPSTAGLASETDLQTVSAGVVAVSGELPNYLKVTAYEADSGKFALKSEIPTKVSDLTDSTNYYKKTETSSKTELSTEFAKYVTTSTLNTVSSTLNDDIEYVSGQVDNKVDKPTPTQTGKLVYDGDTSAWAAIGLDDYVPYSATELVIGSGNEVDYQYNNVKNNFVQGTNNIVTNNNSETFVQGKANKLFTSQGSLLQGYGNSATNYYNFAQGALNDANSYSFTQGSNNTANNFSQAAGQTNSAWTASVAFGNANTAKDYTFTQGTINSAVTTSFAQGSANRAKYDSLAQGNRNSAFSQSLAQGHYNSADDGSLAQGKHNTAYSHSFAQGSMNYADNNALAQGGDNTAKYFSQALGFGLSIQGSRGATDGDAYISGGLAIGTYNQTSAGVAFVVGNGHSNGADEEPTRSDAFLIYPDGSVSAKGDISANGVKLGAGGSFTGVTTAGSISGDGLTNPLGLKTSAEQALTSVSNKVDKPTSLVNKYLVLRTDNSGDVSGWYDFTDQYYNKDQANSRFVATAFIDTTTLSGNGNASNRKLGVNTDVIATKDYVNSSFLPLSGGTVSGDVVIKSTGTNILTVNTTATLMGQSRVNSLTDTSAIGTNWLGVNSLGGGFLKNVQGGDVGALNGTSIQINFAPDGANSYGNITVNSQGNESKVVHVPTASYTKMSTFDSETGPNYMLRKTANGFDIGAAVINTTELPENVQANAYYFIYEM